MPPLSQRAATTGAPARHHIELNTWHSKGAPPAPVRSAGLYHTAILYPTRRDLAVILKRLVDAKYPITGVSDHGVSEAIYRNDPDQNGVELYFILEPPLRGVASRRRRQHHHVYPIARYTGVAARTVDEI